LNSVIVYLLLSLQSVKNFSDQFFPGELLNE